MGHTYARGEGELKGKLANGMCSQYSSHYHGTWCIQHYYRWCAQLGCQQSTQLTPSANLNGFVRFAERRNLVSAHVPSHFKRSLHSSLFLLLVAGPQLWESISFPSLHPQAFTHVPLHVTASHLIACVWCLEIQFGICVGTFMVLFRHRHLRL